MDISNLLQKHYQSNIVDWSALERKILLTIVAKERNRRLVGIIAWSIVLMLATSGFIISLSSFAVQFSTSGISELLATIIGLLREGGLLASYGADFLYSLVESFPATPLIEGLFTVAVGLIAMRGLLRNENNYLKLYGHK